MPKERESELHHLEGKALQMHSSCVKKVPAARHKETIEFDVLSDLKKLSDKADQLAEEKITDDNGLTEWFEAIKKTMEKIRDSKIEDIKDIEYPPSIKTFINVPVKEEVISSTIEATPVLNMTISSAKKPTPVNNTLSDSKMVTPVSKVVTSGNKPATLASQMVTPSTAIRKKVNPFVLMHQLNKEVVNAHTDSDHHQNKSKPLLGTPGLSRTYDQMNTTIVLNSTSAANCNQTPSGTVSSNDNGIVLKSNSKKKTENLCPNSHGMLTRSGSKRKSSDNKNKSSKKQKIDSHNISSATLNKKAKSRHPLRDLKTSVLAAENKKSAVIKAPILQKPSLISKEQLHLEELKKKEKKREENLKRIQEEKKQKAEQDKKTREEKRTKTQQKRLQLEKEKEEKREIEAKKSQVKVNKENPKKTTRAKELVEQHVKESKSSIITSTTQSSNNSDDPKTPVNKKSDEIQSYDLTPVPDSSTYNFSDDEEDDKTAKKPIPLWAIGVHLKSALMQQYYYPVDTDALFGSVIDPPDLVEIFKMNKKRYLKRTSSAVWNSPPDRGFHH